MFEKYFLLRIFLNSSKIKGNGKRFVFLTDLHDKEFGPDNDRLLQAIREAKPDLVLVGGDMMVAKGVGDITLSLKFLKRLSELLWAASPDISEVRSTSL